jgi:hypothetical protein
MRLVEQAKPSSLSVMRGTAPGIKTGAVQPQPGHAWVASACGKVRDKLIVKTSRVVASTTNINHFSLYELSNRTCCLTQHCVEGCWEALIITGMSCGCICALHGAHMVFHTVRCVCSAYSGSGCSSYVVYAFTSAIMAWSPNSTESRCAARFV